MNELDELFQATEDVDTNAPVETRRFQDPYVPTVQKSCRQLNLVARSHMLGARKLPGFVFVLVARLVLAIYGYICELGVYLANCLD
jgi:hypothetical protein